MNNTLSELNVVGEFEKDLDFVVEQQVVKTQVTFNAESQIGKVLQNCLTRIDSLTKEVDELKLKNQTSQSVVSSESPLYDLWNNEVDDVWNNF